MSKQSDLVVISQIGVPSPFNPQTTAIGPGDAVTTTYAVTVASSGGANRYFIDGVAYPKLTLSRTYIYIFDLSNSTNTGHPLRFKDASGSSYSTGVVVTGTPGAAGAKVTLTVAANAPDALRYYCTVHGNGMGNTISVTNSASLDIGTHNYFDSENLTADTSVNFASVPTTANWRYSFVAKHQDPYDIARAVFAKSKGVTSLPHAIYFKPDGYKMYIADYTGTINEYNLSTAWDVGTAALLRSKNISSLGTEVTGLFFRADGIKMYSVNTSNEYVWEFNLSTAWDVTSATQYNGILIRAQDGNPNGLFFKPDGTKMYSPGDDGMYINEYNLSTAWDSSSAVYSQHFSVASQDTGPSGVTFNPTGTIMYLCGYQNNSVYKYNLSTAYDVTSAVYSELFSVASQDTDTTGLFIHPLGIKMYVLGNASNIVNEYDIGFIPKITFPATVVGTTSTFAANDRVTYTFVTADSGSTVDLIAEEII